MSKNILFITADQWRGECLSSLGHPVQTPNLDMLAREGVLFQQNFCNATPCGPSRASIHTGTYLKSHRVTGNHVTMQRRLTNWAEVLRESGMDPVMFGYTDNQMSADDAAGWDSGLPGLATELSLGKLESDPVAWANWLQAHDYPLPESLKDLYFQEKDGSINKNPIGSTTAAALKVPAELHDTWFMVDQVIDYVSSRPSWCVHLSLLRPHPPWTAPEPYNSLYPPEALPPILRPNTLAEERSTHPWLDWMLQAMGGIWIDDKHIQGMKAGYYGLMSEVDANLGRLFATLKANGQWQNTLIIFTSDHGEQLGDHWLIGKTGFYDQSFRVPLIIFDPAHSADDTRGQRVNAFTESIDLMPTMLEWMDVEIPEQCAGRSLLPFLSGLGAPDNWRDAAHWEYDFRGQKIQDGLGLDAETSSLGVLRGVDYKYVHFDGLPSLYFDLAQDPQERRNVIDNHAYSDRVTDAVERFHALAVNHPE
ncbi:MAG: sulfatase-like hydrolase/transferase [bacterium]